MKTTGYDIQISNMKGMLIFLVILGHILLIVGSKEGVLVDIIYSFHMPAFIFISGICSQKGNFKKIGKLIGLFIIFQPLFLLLGFLVGYYPAITMKMLVTPAYHLWYLLALAAWTLLVIYANKRGKYAVDTLLLVVILLVLAVVNRYFYSTQFLTITRILSFAPYFIAGFYLSTNGLLRTRELIKKYKYIGIVTLIILVSFSYYLFSENPNAYFSLFVGFAGKATFSATIIGYLISVFASFVLAFLWIMLMIILVPTKKTNLIVVGNNTLYPYILHPIIIFLMVPKMAYFSEQTAIFQLTFALLMAISVFSIFTMILKNKKV
ncbi:acyltransferase [Listeria ivanovii]|uniref:acyltransferase family protein n=1 Tax=Listeria ivanovii TaxID=1638 RepID=UPI000DA71684|nr:acyltransferase family protein [Listeria ivanovii]PZF88326.1 acyltransferase [Listeria ivanovii]PZF93446.1 acyltransferase [Listeria ivanovii]PZG04275.1 acyltransferase [Listeria ivanovii]PZG08692.1 acyltransferase [Listeria ivanovii]PZG25608.1 acyltransferase [Listeria ivanovii]